MALELRVRAHSETGLVRRNNQDSGYASPTMLLVADGMGGAAAGDLASRVAVEECSRVDGGADEGEAMLDSLEDASLLANRRLAELIAQNPDLDGMGTTLCGGLFDGHDFGIVHLGDSRFYLLRGGGLSRLTHDHSWVQSLIDEGRLDEGAALTHPHRSLLLRVLNGQPFSRPDLILITLRDGDRLLVCSDGLCGAVSDSDIAAGLSISEPAAALDALVAAAHRAGGSDNITILLADVFDPALAFGGDVGPAAGAPPGSPTSPRSAASPNTVRPTEPPKAPPAAATATSPGALKPPAAPDAAAAAPPFSPASLSPASPASPAAANSEGEDTEPLAALWDDHDTVFATPAERRRQLLAAPAVVAEGRAAGAGFFIGAAAAVPAAAEPLAAAAAAKGSDATAEADRYRPVARRGPRWGLITVIVFVCLALSAALSLGYFYTKEQYFVSAEGGYVAIFQGFPGDLAGIATHRTVEKTDIALADLPLVWRQQVDNTITAGEGGLAQAQLTVAELAKEREACLARRTARLDATASPDPSPTTGTTSTVAPNPTATMSPTSNPTAGTSPASNPTTGAASTTGPDATAGASPTTGAFSTMAAPASDGC
ncbi:MAG: protein phosphatase 2C domain-containing protein [Propionibacteriaceae bacterium]|jgi:protein phosphatase|nr:protein phosphatase 2C domain-containing protein [Propionibacteriaceae bacterium]